ncbi:MAG: hypothetical protein R3B13_34240 [Polyangiaceae bacterium]
MLKRSPAAVLFALAFPLLVSACNKDAEKARKALEREQAELEARKQQAGARAGQAPGADQEKRKADDGGAPRKECNCAPGDPLCSCP